MPEALLVDALRTPLLPWEAAGAPDPVALAATPIQGLLDRAAHPPGLVDELVLGGVLGPDSDLFARQVALLADLPWHLPVRAVRRGDAGGLAALQAATEAICAGLAEVVVAAAVGHPALGRPRGGARHDALAPGVQWRHGLVDPAEAAAWRARAAGVEAAELEALVAGLAELAGEDLAEELVPTQGPGEDWLLEDQPATGPAQGAVAVLLASSERPDGPELPVRARVVGVRAAAVDPAQTWGGGVVALRRVLAELVMDLDEVDRVVLDGPDPAAWEAARRELGLSGERVAPHLGHAVRGRLVGAPGLRAVTSLLAELEARDLRFGAVLSESLDGQGTAVILDRETYF